MGDKVKAMDLLSNLKIDQLDRDVIQLLRDDPVMTNRALSAKLSIREATVAARIRDLEDRGILRVVARRNFAATGLNTLAVLDIWIGHDTVRDVALKVSVLHGVCTVLIMPGKQLVVYIASEDMGSLARTIVEDISRIDGVIDVTTNIMHRCLKWNNAYGDLTDELTHEYGFYPRDELNEAIFRFLFNNARIGNSEIARRLSISEGTVRKRIKQLEKERMLKFTTLLDGAAIGVRAFACVKIKTDPRRTIDVGRAAAGFDSAGVVGLTLGIWDVIIFCASVSREQLMSDINEGFAQIEGVTSMEVQEMVSTVSHNAEFYLEVDS